MTNLDDKNKLLDDIENVVEETLNIKQGDLHTIAITNASRLSLLINLTKFSDKIPHPSQDENTLTRWQILAYVSGIDLTVAKWFESHLDALSILDEIGYRGVTDGIWAVWAAEGTPIDYKNSKLNGVKAWCSGANIVDKGLLTYRNDDGQSQLLIVDMKQDGIVKDKGIEIDNDAWQAVGMQYTDTATVTFNQVDAVKVGAANAYLDRVGFWHGAAGVASCWYGGAVSIANYLVRSHNQKPNDFKAMYLGEISTAIALTQHYFKYVADLIDHQPYNSNEVVIRQLRACVEQLARQVLETVGLALGATPFCANAHFARLSADLAVFIRQSHGAFDLKTIGEQTSEHYTELNAITNNKQVNLWQL